MTTFLPVCHWCIRTLGDIATGFQHFGYLSASVSFLVVVGGMEMDLDDRTVVDLGGI